MTPIRLPSHYAALITTKADRARMQHAARQAFAVLGRGAEAYLYRFAATGQWSWAALNGPIGAQLLETGEAYPGAPVNLFYVVTLG